MSKKFKKSTLKYVCAIAISLFSLVALFTGTLTWFQSIRVTSNANDDFQVDVLQTTVKKITIHEFLGETQEAEVYGQDDASNPLQAKAFTFNPNGTIAYDPNLANQQGFDKDGFYISDSYVRLHEYSLDSPNHPVLLMFEVSSGHQRIDLSTTYTFLGNEKPEVIKAQVNSKADLNALNKSSFSAGDYFEVLSDEEYDAQNKPCTLYYYDGTSTILVTIDDGTNLESNAYKISDRYIKVLEDNEHGGVATIYQYNASTSSFEMKWMDLGDADSGKTNPLSSAVDFHYFTFSNEYNSINDLVTNKNIVKETANQNGEIISLTNQSNQSCISINQGLFTQSNSKSFIKFTSNTTYTYQNNIILIDEDIDNISYIGVVINYNYHALEYIFSNNLGHFALNAGLQFVCDWTTKF